MQVCFDTVTAEIDRLLSCRDRVMIAIDGNCTAGKTTLAAFLSRRYDRNVFHMDDFFLRPEQRTPERFAQPGGNVDYERFHEQVLIPLMSGKAFSYQPYSCKTAALSSPVFVRPKKLEIVEGTYSLHPHFRDPHELKIFLSVPPEIQRQRLASRPQHLYERFLNEWIPMERAYFDAFDILNQCHIQLETSH